MDRLPGFWLLLQPKGRRVTNSLNSGAVGGTERERKRCMENFTISLADLDGISEAGVIRAGREK
jgi:hypothetical protein